MTGAREDPAASRRIPVWIAWVLILCFALTELAEVWIEGATAGTLTRFSFVASPGNILGQTGFILLVVWMINSSWSALRMVLVLFTYTVLAVAAGYFIARPLTQNFLQWLA